MASFLDGQVTLFASRYTSLKYVLYNLNLFFEYPCHLHNITGQEGFEPPTPGFGVRCSIR